MPVAEMGDGQTLFRSETPEDLDEDRPRSASPAAPPAKKARFFAPAVVSPKAEQDAADVMLVDDGSVAGSFKEDTTQGPQVTWEEHYFGGERGVVGSSVRLLMRHGKLRYDCRRIHALQGLHHVRAQSR